MGEAPELPGHPSCSLIVSWGQEPDIRYGWAGSVASMSWPAQNLGMDDKAGTTQTGAPAS